MPDKRKIKQFVIITILSSILLIAISPTRLSHYEFLGEFGPHFTVILEYFSFFLLTICSLNYKKRKISFSVVILAMLLGISLIQVPLRISSWNSTTGSLPIYIAEIVGILTGALFYRTKKGLKFFVLIAAIVAFLCFQLQLVPMYWHNLNFGTFTGKIDNSSITPFEIQTDKGDTILLTDLSKRITVIDCWYTYCGVCYQKMPKVESLYQKYKDNKNIQFYALHARIEDEGETCESGAKKIQKMGYTIPSLSISIKDPILKDFGVDGYPTVLIFDAESKLIFRGNIERASKFVDELMNLQATI